MRADPTVALAPVIQLPIVGAHVNPFRYSSGFWSICQCPKCFAFEVLMMDPITEPASPPSPHSRVPPKAGDFWIERNCFADNQASPGSIVRMLPTKFVAFLKRFPTIPTGL